MRMVIVAFLAASVAIPAENRLGKPLGLKTPTPIADVLRSPDRYTGKPVQVKGRITEVCQMAGCWTSLEDAEGHALRVKVNDGEIVFPKDAVGKTVIAEGILQKFELTREQAIARARHEAEEQSRKFDPKSVKAGITVYQLQGSGAILLD